MARRRKRTIANLTLERVGMREGARVSAFMMQWWLLHHELGREPGIEEYAEFWDISRAKAFEDQRRFRNCWSEVASPSGLAAIVGLRLEGDQVEAPFTVTVPNGVLEG